MHHPPQHPSLEGPAPQQLTQGPVPESSQRAILLAPNSVPPQPINKYDLQGAPSAKRICRSHRADRRAYAAVLPIPEAYIPPALNLHINRKPLTYRSAKNGPDRLLWERAEVGKLIRLLDSETIVPILYNGIPENRLGDIVYYNPVVKQNRNDEFHQISSPRHSRWGSSDSPLRRLRSHCFPRNRQTVNPLNSILQQEMANARLCRLLSGNPSAGIPLRIQSH